jgi:hypothetical protein
MLPRMPRRHIPLHYASLCNGSWTVTCGQDRGVHGGTLVSTGRSDGRMDGRTKGISRRTSYYLRPRRGVPLHRARVTSQSSCCHTSKMLLHYNECLTSERQQQHHRSIHPPSRHEEQWQCDPFGVVAGSLECRLVRTISLAERGNGIRMMMYVDFVVAFSLFHRSSISTPPW